MIDADDFRVNGAAARDYTNLTQNGLIRVTIPLPANVKLLDCGRRSRARQRPVRAAKRLPTSGAPSPRFSTSTSRVQMVPIRSTRAARTSAEGTSSTRASTRCKTRRSARSATTPGIAVDPPTKFLDDVAAFQQSQFSSASVKLLSDALTAGTRPLPDPDSALNALETTGKAVFNRACAQCHGNMGGHPSGSTPIQQGTEGTPTAIVRYHDIMTTCPRPVDTVSPPRFQFAPCSASQMENVRTYEITNSGIAPSGTPCGGSAPQPACVTRVTTSDPGRLLLTGYPAAGGPGDIQHFDIPSLRGIARTAPYFHNNTAATLEEMLEHYKQFFKRVQVQNPAAHS